MALQVREKERKCIHVLPSFVAHAIGYGMATSVHNTVMPRCVWLYRVRLSCPDGTVLQVHRAWQGMVLDIAVDLSTLLYLLYLIPEPSLSRHPWSIVPSRSRLCWSEKEQPKKEVGARLWSQHGQAFRSGTKSLS